MTQDEIVARNVLKVRPFIDAGEAIDPDVAIASLLRLGPWVYIFLGDIFPGRFSFLSVQC